nr:pyridoxal-phosphate dependent enzyme [Gandjariella thermophila]
MLTLDDVRAAAKRLHGVAHRTPVLTSGTLDQHVGARVFIKAENFQRVGAFKFRGAYNAIAQLDAGRRTAGVLAYSSGNHAQAIALAASLLGTKALIVMPEDAPPTKVAATQGYGAEIVRYDRYTEDRAAVAARIAAERGMTVIPPFDHPHVMAGQGTVALELLEQTGPLDALVVPMGGGGLMAGCATVAKALHPGVRMVGVEPVNGDDNRRSLAAGERVRIPVPRTIADGLALDTPGELTFAVNRRLVDEVVLVDDDEIRSAMAWAFDRLKVVVEPSGAAPLAALLTGRIGDPPPRVGLVFSGGNVGLARFVELLAGHAR